MEAFFSIALDWRYMCCS